jgi:hypothetical protein
MTVQQHSDLPPDQEHAGEDDYFHEVTREEAAVYFDSQARLALGISGEEFLRRWDDGEFKPVPDTREYWSLGRLVMLIPLGRHTPS